MNPTAVLMHVGNFASMQIYIFKLFNEFLTCLSTLFYPLIHIAAAAAAVVVVVVVVVVVSTSSILLTLTLFSGYVGFVPIGRGVSVELQARNLGTFHKYICEGNATSKTILLHELNFSMNVLSWHL